MTNPLSYASYFVRSGQYEASPISLLKSLKTKFDLNELEAKVIWLSCPEFQEMHIRGNIAGRKNRGGSEYGSRHWLRRHFKVSEEEFDDIFMSFWANDGAKVSVEFLRNFTQDRLAEICLSEAGKDAYRSIKSRFKIP